MTVQSKKRQNFGRIQPESWYNKNHISNRRVETMFELMIENEMEKEYCKLFNDMFIRKLELPELLREMHLLPKNGRDRSAMELRGLAGQLNDVQTAKLTRGESTSEKEDI